MIKIWYNHNRKFCALHIKYGVKMNYENKIITIPNILSVIRVLMIPLFIYLYVTNNIVAAIIVFLLSGLTDVVDGFIARKFNMVSKIGKMLDPLADKITQVSIAICLAISNPEILPLIILFGIKELLMLSGAYILLRKGKNPSESKWWGKFGTVIIYTFLSLVLFSNLFPNTIPSWVIEYGMYFTAGVILFSLYNYYLIFKTIMMGKENIEIKQE